MGGGRGYLGSFSVLSVTTKKINFLGKKHPQTKSWLRLWLSGGGGSSQTPLMALLLDLLGT